MDTVVARLVRAGDFLGGQQARQVRTVTHAGGYVDIEFGSFMRIGSEDGKHYHEGWIHLEHQKFAPTEPLRVIRPADTSLPYLAPNPQDWLKARSDALKLLKSMG